MMMKSTITSKELTVIFLRSRLTWRWSQNKSNKSYVKSKIIEMVQSWPFENPLTRTPSIWPKILERLQWSFIAKRREVGSYTPPKIDSSAIYHDIFKCVAFNLTNRIDRMILLQRILIACHNLQSAFLRATSQTDNMGNIKLLALLAAIALLAIVSLTERMFSGEIKVWESEKSWNLWNDWLR